MNNSNQPCEEFPPSNINLQQLLKYNSLILILMHCKGFLLECEILRNIINELRHYQHTKTRRVASEHNLDIFARLSWFQWYVLFRFCNTKTYWMSVIQNGL
jgi:hypothetical protein